MPLYGAQPDITSALMGLAKETKARGWWQAFADVMPDYFDLYVGLEAAASRLFVYNGELVPGLFQTEDYASTVVRTHNPDLGPAEVARRVRLRMARQAILHRPIGPPVAPGRAGRVRAPPSGGRGRGHGRAVGPVWPKSPNCPTSRCG